MILLRRTRPLTRMIAAAMLVAHGLVLATAGHAHASELRPAGLDMVGQEAPARALGHDELSCAFCQLVNALPEPIAQRMASLHDVAVNSAPAQRPAAPKALVFCDSFSPRAPPALTA